MQRFTRSVLVRTAAVFVAIAAAGGLLVAQNDRLERAERRRAAGETARSTANAIVSLLEGSLAAPHALAAAVRQSGGAQGFERYASELLGIYSGIDSLQLAPGGILEHIHPIAGNEAALGLDLLKIPVQRPFIERARATRRLVLTDPFPLAQGGIGLAARVPVFLDGDDGDDHFWGIASAILSMSRLLEGTGLDALEAEGYAYELRSGTSGEERLLASAGGPLEDPVAAALPLPGGAWSLAIAPRAGWGPRRLLLVEYGAVLALAFALASFACRVFQLPEALAREVAERTAELEHDLEERRKLEARVRQAEKLEAVGRLAGGVAHDFNNILTVVLGSASELRDRAPDAEGRELADEILESAQRAAGLTRQLLAFSRRQPLRLEDVDLNEVIRGMERLLRRVIPENVVIEARLDSAPLVVRADAGQLEQVLLNLVVNARDAMPDGGRVFLVTSGVERAPLEAAVAAGPCALLEVRDTGTGMDLATRDRVFEPFFTTKEVGRGTGLGLPTVLGIVQQSGGGVVVDSAPGEGAAFRVYLPRVEGPARPVAAPPPAKRGGREAVLVVEDDPSVRAVLRRVLEGGGFAVHEAARPEDALAAAAPPARFDALVTDMVMPGMSGGELAARLLAARPGLRVVFVSGYTEDASIRSGALPAGQVFLPKPFTGDEVIAAVRRALDA